MSADVQTLTIPAEHLEVFRAGALMALHRNADSVAQDAQDVARRKYSAVSLEDLRVGVSDLNECYAVLRQVDRAPEATASLETTWTILEDAEALSPPGRTLAWLAERTAATKAATLAARVRAEGSH